MTGWMFVFGTLCGLAAMTFPKLVLRLRANLADDNPSPEGTRAHTETEFTFVANGSFQQVIPLFGADKERLWAPGWNPQFVHPIPSADREGMVFTTAHEYGKAVWANTLFDERNGRIQYAYVIPGEMVTVIHLKLTPQGAQTRVKAKYDRTALSPEADAHVRHMAARDRKSGPEWAQQVNAYLLSVRH